MVIFLEVVYILNPPDGGVAKAELIAKTLQVRLEAYHVDTPEPLHFCDGPSGRGVAAAA